MVTTSGDVTITGSYCLLHKISPPIKPRWANFLTLKTSVKSVVVACKSETKHSYVSLLSDINL